MILFFQTGLPCIALAILELSVDHQAGLSVIKGLHHHRLALHGVFKQINQACGPQGNSTWLVALTYTLPFLDGTRGSSEPHSLGNLGSRWTQLTAVRREPLEQIRKVSQTSVGETTQAEDNRSIWRPCRWRGPEFEQETESPGDGRDHILQLSVHDYSKR